MTESPALGATSGQMAPSISAPVRAAGLPQLIVLLAATCLTILGAVLLTPVLPQMEQAFAGTPGAAALVPIMLTVPALMIGVTAPFAGLIADKIDRKRVLVGGLAVYAVAGTAPLYLQSLGAIIGSRVVLGLCEAAIMTCCTTLISDYWAGAQRARYLGLQTFVGSFAGVIFIAVGGVLGASGWRAPFWLYAAAALLVVPCALVIWQPTGHKRGAAMHRSLPPVPWKQVGAPLAVSLVGGTIFASLLIQLSVVLAGVGVGSSALIGGIAALMALGTAIGAGCFGWMSHLRPRTLLPAELALVTVGLLVVFVSSSVLLIAIGGVLFGLGTGGMVPTLLTWTVNRLEFEQRGRGTGLWTGAWFIGQFVSPLVLAALGAAVGGLQSALGVVAAVAAALAVAVAVAVRRNNAPLNVTND